MRASNALLVTKQRVLAVTGAFPCLFAGNMCWQAYQAFGSTAAHNGDVMPLAQQSQCHWTAGGVAAAGQIHLAATHNTIQLMGNNAHNAKASGDNSPRLLQNLDNIKHQTSHIKHKVIILRTSYFS